jgi:hypothetical protein
VIGPSGIWYRIIRWTSNCYVIGWERYEEIRLFQSLSVELIGPSGKSQKFLVLLGLRWWINQIVRRNSMDHPVTHGLGWTEKLLVWRSLDCPMGEVGPSQKTTKFLQKVWGFRVIYSLVTIGHSNGSQYRCSKWFSLMKSTYMILACLWGFA